MRTWRVVVVASVAWLSAVAPAAPTAAEPAGGGRPLQSSPNCGREGVRCGCVATGSLGCNINVRTPGDVPEPERPTGSVALPPLLWEGWFPLSPVIGGRPPQRTPCTTGDGREGVLVAWMLTDRATGLVVQRGATTCEAPGDPPPPNPPTEAELSDWRPLPPLTISANPSGRGLAGLESWFWLDDPGGALGRGTVQASVTIDEWRVDATLRADSWHWTVDGAGYDSAGPGSEAAPAVTHRFERKGTFEVTVEVVWSGEYTLTFTRPGFETVVTGEGLATSNASSRDYEVVEVRSVLDTPPEGRS